MSVLNPNIDPKYKTITNWFGFDVELENYHPDDATCLYFSKIADITIGIKDDVITFIRSQVDDVYAPEPYSTDWYKEVIKRLSRIAEKMWEIPAHELTYGSTNEYSVKYKDWYCSHISISHHQKFSSQQRKEISIFFHEYPR